MKPLLPAWSDTAIRLTWWVAALLVAVLVGGPMIYVRTVAHERRRFLVDQPVQFDHRHHTSDDGIECLYCHSGARRDAAAGIPAAELCMGCHSQVWPDSLQLEPVRRSYFSGAPLAWSRVHQLPDYVYFNHAIHIGKGVTCETCHGRVERMALAYQVAPLSMDWCVSCHRTTDQVRRLTSCTICHR